MKLINFQTSLREVGGVIFSFGFLLVVFKPSRITQKPKYSIFVYLKKYFSILHLIPTYFSLFKVSSNLCTLFTRSHFVHIKRLYMYKRKNSNHWNKLFIFCWKCFGEFLTPMSRIPESRIMSPTVTRLNIPATHSQKFLMDNTITIGCHKIQDWKLMILTKLTIE